MIAKKSRTPLGYINLEIPAQQANPSPPIGPALGQRGLNIMKFCEQFNAMTKKPDLEPGTPIPVIISYFADKSFEIELKSPPVSFFVKRAVGVKIASKKPGTDFVGTITLDQITEIAKSKMLDMGVDNIEAAIKMVIGTCRSMGVKVA